MERSGKAAIRSWKEWATGCTFAWRARLTRSTTIIGLDHTILSTPLYPPHYPHITAFKEELRHWRFYYLDPSVMRLESALREIDALGYDGRDLAGYYHGLRIRNGASSSRISRIPSRVVVPAADGVRTTVTPGGLVRLDLLEGNTDYSSRVISDGTLRVLGLLAMLAPGGPIHDHRLRGAGERRPPPPAADCGAPARQCRPRHGKQVIVTTHSSKLPDYIERANYTHVPTSGGVS